MIARFAALGLLACLALLPASAQNSIEDLVSQARADWMLGKWEATTDSGDTITLNLSWELKKNFVLLQVKTPDMEIKGYSYKDPNSEEVKYLSFDDRGSVNKGVWGMEADELVLRTEAKVGDGAPRKVGFVFAGSASEGLQVRMHALDQYDTLVSPARMTIKFKKK